MAWVAVNKDGSESIFDVKPRRVDRFWSDEFYINDDVRWDSEIELPKGSIKKLIGDNTILTLFNDKDLHNSNKIITFATLNIERKYDYKSTNYR